MWGPGASDERVVDCVPVYLIIGLWNTLLGETDPQLSNAADRTNAEVATSVSVGLIAREEACVCYGIIPVLAAPAGGRGLQGLCAA